MERNSGTSSTWGSPESQRDLLRNAHLQAMVQDFISDPSSANTVKPILTSSRDGPVSYEPPDPTSPDGHRYMLMLYEQPSWWSIPLPMLEYVTERSNFDLEQFTKATRLSTPTFTTWMVVQARQVREESERMEFKK
jgi:hypothetical protein